MGNSCHTKKKQPQIPSKRVLDELEEASKEYEEDDSRRATNSKQRISIISFDTFAMNKQKIKNTIVGITIRNTTNITGGVNKGQRMIKNRKYKNPVTCMFLLSDGKDDNKGADERVAKGLFQYDIKDSLLVLELIMIQKL